MNSSSAFAPQPALRRRRQWSVEPLVFAVLLTALTLGINLSDINLDAEQADSQPASSQVAAVR